MDRYLLAQREYRTGCMVRIKHFIAKMCCIVGGKLYGNYLISGYMAVKLMYLANAVGQLFLLDAFLKIDYHLYGVHVVEQLIRGQDFHRSKTAASCGRLETRIGPRYDARTERTGEADPWPGLVALGEVPSRDAVRVRGEAPVSRAPVRRPVRADHQPLQREALHLRLVLVRLPGADHHRQLAALAVPVAVLARARADLPGHVQYLRKQLRAFDATQREAGILAKFAENYLRRDGMFIVRLIGMNMGEVAAGEVICGLWNNYSIERRTIAEKSGRKGVGKSRTGAAGQRVEVV